MVVVYIFTERCILQQVRHVQVYVLWDIKASFSFFSLFYLISFFCPIDVTDHFCFDYCMDLLYNVIYGNWIIG